MPPVDQQPRRIRRKRPAGNSLAGVHGSVSAGAGTHGSTNVAKGPSSKAPAAHPKPVTRQVADTVKSQPKVQRRIKRAIKREQANLRVSGDRPTPGGRTHGIDARKSPEYRDALRFLIGQEHKRLDFTAPSDHAVSADYLHDLRTLTRRGDGAFLRDGKIVRDDSPDNPLSQFYEAAKHGASETTKADLAPVITTLEQSTRPLHAVAGATDAVLSGKNIPKAAWRGLKNEDRKTFGKVLRKAGAPSWLSGTAGFALDVALDPTTYTTLGAGSVVRRAAEKEAAKATKRAAAAGLSKEQAQRFGDRAFKQTVKKAADKDATGLTVKFAGREVPGVRKATAKIGGRKLRRKASESGPVQAVRRVGADVNPNVAPAGITREEAREVTRATRTARAKAHRKTYAAQQRAIAIKRTIGEGNYQQVIDAIEAGDLTKLSPELRHAAIEVRSQLRGAQRAARQAGIKTGEVENYIPHVPAEATGRTGPRIKRRSTSRTIAPRSSRSREDGRTLAEIRESRPGHYSEDLPQLVAGRMREAAESTTKADLNRRLAENGRRIKADGSDLHLNPDEAVFHVQGSNIREVTHSDELARLTQPTKLKATTQTRKAEIKRQIGDDAYDTVQAAVKNRDLSGLSPELRKIAAEIRPRMTPGYQATQGGRFVVLNRQAVDRALSEAGSHVPDSTILRGFDRTQGIFKAVATVPNPGFHIRNLIGDTQNAYLAESAPRLARNLGQSARALRHLGKHEEALRDLERRVDPSDAGLKIRGEHVRYADLVKEAEDVGAIRSGFLARELPELAHREVTKSRDRLHRVSRALENREDVVRLATYIGGRKRGLTPEKAAERAAKYHFDYGHLTEFERSIARRIMPFWTFSARNIPLQARSLVTKPGKYANYQKLREEAGTAAGLDEVDEQDVRDLYGKLKQAGVDLPDGWEKYLSPTEQRSAGIPLRIGGVTYTVSAGLPLADLNELPHGLSGQQLTEWKQRFGGLLSPIIKNPGELASNYALYFDGPIENDDSPLVAAPSYVGAFPAAMRKKLGIARGFNKRTGEPAWMWPGHVDYLAHVIPGPTNTAQQLVSKHDRGEGKGTSVLGIAGIKAVPVDPVSAAVGLAYERMSKLQKRQAALRQQLHRGKPISADNPTREYSRLMDQVHVLEEVAYQAKALRGDEVLPKTGAKIRKPASGGGFDWSTQDQPKSSGGFDWSSQDEESEAGGGFDWSGQK